MLTRLLPLGRIGEARGVGSRRSGFRTRGPFLVTAGLAPVASAVSSRLLLCGMKMVRLEPFIRARALAKELKVDVKRVLHEAGCERANRSIHWQHNGRTFRFRSMKEVQYCVVVAQCNTAPLSRSFSPFRRPVTLPLECCPTQASKQCRCDPYLPTTLLHL